MGKAVTPLQPLRPRLVVIISVDELMLDSAVPASVTAHANAGYGLKQECTCRMREW